MPAHLAAPVLTVAFEEMARLSNDANAQTELPLLWNLFTKCKENVQEGSRLENLTWRLWYRSTHQQVGRKADNSLQVLGKPLISNVPGRRIKVAPEAVPASLPSAATAPVVTVSPLSSSAVVTTEPLQPAPPSPTLYSSHAGKYRKPKHSLKQQTPYAAPPAMQRGTSDRLHRQANGSAHISLMLREQAILHDRTLVHSAALKAARQVCQQSSSEEQQQPVSAKLKAARQQSSSEEQQQPVSAKARATFFVASSLSSNTQEQERRSEPAESSEQDESDFSDYSSDISDSSDSFSAAPVFYKIARPTDTTRRSLLSARLRHQAPQSPPSSSTAEHAGPTVSASLRANLDSDRQAVRPFFASRATTLGFAPASDTFPCTQVLW